MSTSTAAWRAAAMMTSWTITTTTTVRLTSTNALPAPVRIMVHVWTKKTGMSVTVVIQTSLDMSAISVNIEEEIVTPTSVSTEELVKGTRCYMLTQSTKF